MVEAKLPIFVLRLMLKWAFTLGYEAGLDKKLVNSEKLDDKCADELMDKYHTMGFIVIHDSGKE